jgi:Ni/Co efflux regulator RcnB
MKKVLALIAIVGFVACNNAEADATKAAADSTAKANAEKATADSLAALAPKADTTKKDTTVAAPAAPVEAPKH